MEVKENSPKIAVLSLNIGEEFKKIVDYGTRSKIQYCNKWGYKYIEDNDIYDNSRPMAWSKILLISKALKDFNDIEFVVWMDSDLFIMNPDIRLEDIIKLMDKKDIMLTKDWDLNTGVIFVRNTDFSKSFFKEVYEQKQFINSPNWEQDAFIYLYQKERVNKEKIELFPKEKIEVIEDCRLFNSFWSNYRYGDFILHFAGCRDKSRLKKIMDKYCPIKKDDETDKQYLSRIQWIKNDSHIEAIKEVEKIHINEVKDMYKLRQENISDRFIIYIISSCFNHKHFIEIAKSISKGDNYLIYCINPRFRNTDCSVENGFYTSIFQCYNKFFIDTLSENFVSEEIADTNKNVNILILRGLHKVYDKLGKYNVIKDGNLEYEISKDNLDEIVTSIFSKLIES